MLRDFSIADIQQKLSYFRDTPEIREMILARGSSDKYGDDMTVKVIFKKDDQNNINIVFNHYIKGKLRTSQDRFNCPIKNGHISVADGQIVFKPSIA